MSDASCLNEKTDYDFLKKASMSFQKIFKLKLVFNAQLMLKVAFDFRIENHA